MEWTKYRNNPVTVPWKIKQSTPCNNNTSLEDPNAPTHSKENGQLSTSLFKTSKCLYWIEEIIQHRFHIWTENRGKCTSQYFSVHWKNCTTQCFKELQKEEQMFHWPTGKKEKKKGADFLSSSKYIEVTETDSLAGCVFNRLVQSLKVYMGMALAAGKLSSPGSTFCANSYFGIHSTPHATAVACKRSWSFCWKCRWQVTAKRHMHPTYVTLNEVTL